jgi:hypothetical protein
MTSFPLSNTDFGTFARISATVGTVMVVGVPAPLEWAAIWTSVEPAAVGADPAATLGAAPPAELAAAAALTVADELDAVVLAELHAAVANSAATAAMTPRFRMKRGRVTDMMLLWMQAAGIPGSTKWTKVT